MDREQLRKKAIGLRRTGKTYSEIQQALKIKIPKSTLSYWCNGIELPFRCQERIKKIVSDNQKKSRAAALMAKKEKRQQFLKGLVGKNFYLIDKLQDKDFLKVILAMIYYCEGSKWKNHSGLMLGNSDPRLLNFYVNLLKKCYPDVISNEIFRCWVSHRADQDINGLNRFWSQKLGIPLRCFYKIKPDPRTVGKPTKREDYKGVCVVSSRGSEIQLELETIAKMLFDKL
ncbi:MAG: hypothetical protein PHU56_01725 [Candidatus Pacebacteria bacterium]|nr:hypothetical protein [Candidatus Paceibacterota bacterium]